MIAMSIILESAGESNYNAPNVLIAALKLLLNFVTKFSEKKSAERNQSKETNANTVNNTNEINTIPATENEKEMSSYASLQKYGSLSFHWLPLIFSLHN
jgi:hypothetical protein